MAREFWIQEFDTIGIPTKWSHSRVSDRPFTPGYNSSEVIHVIEFEAYEAVCRQLKLYSPESVHKAFSLHLQKMKSLEEDRDQILKEAMKLVEASKKTLPALSIVSSGATNRYYESVSNDLNLSITAFQEFLAKRGER